MRTTLPILRTWRDNPFAASGQAELILDADHLRRVVMDGILKARISIDIATADFKAMLIPSARGRRAPSIIEHFRRLAATGVEIRLLHAGTPSAAALIELKAALPENLIIRRCPRLHTKAVIIDTKRMYVGSANLTGAGLGAKADGRRNFEAGIWTTSASFIESVSEYFNEIWEGHHCPGCKRRNVCPVPLEEPRF
jgi:phosphatidylserine/phosphatidylglycerophosphate/cardiolipin synthase-like enzyme